MSSSKAQGEHTPNSDPNSPSTTSANTSAGDLLRRAREAKGMHIETLASALKVPVKKIESLENNSAETNPNNLPFTRALTASVCRHLQIDAPTVLALLPVYTTPVLQEPERKTLADFPQANFYSTRQRLQWLSTLMNNPLAWGTLAVLSVALVFALMPTPISSDPDTNEQRINTPADITATDAHVPVAKVETQLPIIATSTNATNSNTPPTSLLASPLASPPPPAQSASAAPNSGIITLPAPTLDAKERAAKNLIVIQALEEVWIQVLDANRRELYTSTMKAGEEKRVLGSPPFRVVAGRMENVRIHYLGGAVQPPSEQQSGAQRIKVPLQRAP